MYTWFIYIYIYMRPCGRGGWAAATDRTTPPPTSRTPSREAEPGEPVRAVFWPGGVGC